MKLVDKLLCAGAFAAATSLGAAYAQPVPKQLPAARSMAVEATDGEVRKLDKKGLKITLKHGEIRNLGMEPMAMQFEVRDRASIDKLKVGDKVRFKAVHEGGKYVITEIRRAQ